jgi:uncharacterized protein (DUF1501 family)
MQASVPDLMDLSTEPEATFKLYGEDARKPGTYAANCLLARRLAERDVRFVQLYHRGWDQHNELPRHLPMQCRGTDQASAALVTDLKQRGLLDDTLIVWGGEFGRTVYCQGKLTETVSAAIIIRALTWWLAGGGTKPGGRTRQTDDSLTASTQTRASTTCRRPSCTAGHGSHRLLTTQGRWFGQLRHNAVKPRWLERCPLPLFGHGSVRSRGASSALY